MTDFNEVFKDLTLSLEQEIKKEDALVINLESADSIEDINNTILDFKDLAENSKNNRTVPIISKCAGIINEGFVCPEFKNKIAEGVSKELFPVLYRKILDNEEKANPNELLKMILSVHDTKDSILKQQVENLFLHLIDPNTKDTLRNLIDEQPREQN